MTPGVGAPAAPRGGGPGPPPRSRCPRCRSSGCARGSGRSRGAGRGPPGSPGPACRPALRRSPRCRPRRGGCPCGCRPPRRPPARRRGRSRVRVPAVSVIMMMRLPRGGRAGRGPADQDVDGAPPSSYQVTWGPDRRRWVAGRPGRGQDRDQGRPPGPPVELRVTRPRRTGTYILHVQICCKGAPDRDRPRTKARNINVSLPALRRDPGLCNRFGQNSAPASPRSPTRPTAMANSRAEYAPAAPGAPRARSPSASSMRPRAGPGS